MKALDIIMQIEQLAEASGTKLPDALVLLRLMSAELAEIAGKAQWDWASIHLDPAVSTIAGVRYYNLPENFPENFVRHDDGWVCKLDDGTSEVALEYVAPAEFFTRNLRAEANGRPFRYTIVTLSGGGRQLGLSPPPDGSYSIDGLYVPTDWTLNELSSVPPIPNNSAVLKYSVLRHIDPRRYTDAYREEMGALLLRAAQNRRAGMRPIRDRKYTGLYQWRT